MTTTTFSDIRSASSTRIATAGAIAGLGGGLVFGILMGMMGMLPMDEGLGHSDAQFSGQMIVADAGETQSPAFWGSTQ